MYRMVKKINKVYSEKFVFWSLLATLIFSAVSYGFFVNQTILNIVDRENLNAEIVSLGSEISSLEFKYISLKNEVDLDYAHSVGFVDIDNVKFASRKIPAPSLSLNGNY